MIKWSAFIWATILVMIALGLAKLLKVDPTASLAVLILFNYYYDKFDKEGNK